MSTPMSCVGVLWKHRLLLIQRGLDGLYPGLWNLPGGKAEAYKAKFGKSVKDEMETPFQCALRELREETGILMSGWASDRPVCSYKTDRGTVTLYVFMLEDKPEVELESAALGYGWFDLDSVAALPKLGMAPSLAVHEYKRMLVEGAGR